MLYYTTIILLHRPFRGNLSCRAACRDAAKGVEHFILLMEQSFALSKSTYIKAYCAYTAATVAVQDTKDDMPGARSRVGTYLRALKAISSSCPGIQRSIAIIEKCLDSSSTLSPRVDAESRVHSNMSSGGVSAPLGNTQQHQQDFLETLPAFPFDIDNMGVPMGNTRGHQGSTGQLDLHLDSYPQDWFNFTDDMLDQFNFDFTGYNGVV